VDESAERSQKRVTPRGARGERAVAAVDDAPERAMGMRE
jgi:hypothetical protein